MIGRAGSGEVMVNLQLVVENSSYFPVVASVEMIFCQRYFTEQVIRK